MTKEPTDRYDGRTIDEQVQLLAASLDHDAEGLWTIVSLGKDGFGLRGDHLARFVRLVLRAMMHRGARPVLGGGQSEHDWIVQARYGSEPDDIVENVMKEGLAGGAQDGDPGGLWFALPKYAWTPPGTR